MQIVYPHIESDDTRYAYAVGRTRALEVRLLSAHKIARLLEADSAPELLRGLQDTDYGGWLPGDPRGYEEIIRNGRIELYRLVEKLILERVFVEILRLRYDYYNAKVLLKGSIGEKEVDRLLSDFGNVEKGEMKLVFQEERYDRLPYGLSRAITEAISIYYGSGDSRFLDIVLDKYYYGYLTGGDGRNLKVAATPVVGNVFMEVIVKIEIDLINIKTLLRIRQLGEPRSLFAKSFIYGGWIEFGRFTDSFDEPIEGIARYFQYTPYAKIFSEGIEYLQSKNSFLRLERLCDNHLIEFLRSARYLAFGVEPVIAYFYAKENEFKILRMIFVGKLNAVPDELIKERLPEVY